MKQRYLFAEILITSADEAFVRSTRRVLQAAGYTVRSETDHDATVAAVRDAPPDLILLDVALEETDAHEIIRRLKAEASLPFVPIVAVGRHTHDEIASALNAGADEFISKPVDNAELLTRIRAMLRLKITTDELADLNETLEQKVEERTRELEEAHAQLRHNEKLAALGRLSASVAHEINNPISAILAHLYLLKKELPNDSKMREDLDLVEHEVDLIAELVEQLRHYSKPPRRDRRPVILNEVLENVMTLTEKDLEKHGIEVVHDLDDSLSPVEASASQVEEVFMNLILNARDAMPEGGTLTLCTREDHACVEAQVIDTGMGIDPEARDRIFEPFFTTKGEEGTGLGLAISHSIVEDHGGEITVESQVGQGTTFTLQLPKATV